MHKLYYLKIKQTRYTKFFFIIIGYIIDVWLLIAVSLKTTWVWTKPKKSGNLVEETLDIKKKDVFIKSESVEEWIFYSAHRKSLVSNRCRCCCSYTQNIFLCRILTRTHSHTCSQYNIWHIYRIRKRCCTPFCFIQH